MQKTFVVSLLAALGSTRGGNGAAPNNYDLSSCDCDQAYNKGACLVDCCEQIYPTGWEWCPY